MCENHHRAAPPIQSLRKYLAKVVGGFISQRTKFRVQLGRQDGIRWQQIGAMQLL